MFFSSGIFKKTSLSDYSRSFRVLSICFSCLNRKIHAQKQAIVSELEAYWAMQCITGTYCLTLLLDGTYCLTSIRLVPIVCREWDRFVGKENPE